MPQTVNPPAPITPATVRAYMARYDIRYRDIARLRGSGPAAVRMAVRADLTGRPISQRLLREILDAANVILLEREEKAA